MVVTMILAYVLIMNILAFALYGIDKRRAIRHTWRIPERTLLLSALAGGSIGALLGMRVFRHKTKHWKFKICVPLCLVWHLAIIVFIGWYV